MVNMDIKLIKRLAADAGLTDSNLSDWVIPHGNAKVELCKFAELIAKECAQECQSIQTVSGTDDVERGWNAAIRRMTEIITNKFAPY